MYSKQSVKGKVHNKIQKLKFMLTHKVLDEICIEGKSA